MIKLLIALVGISYADGHLEDNKCKAQVVIKYVYRDRIVEKVVKKDVTRKNRLYLIAGNGPSDTLSVTNNTASSGDENFLGVGYMRDFGRLNLGVQADSSESVSGTIGVNW